MKKTSIVVLVVLMLSMVLAACKPTPTPTPTPSPVPPPEVEEEVEEPEGVVCPEDVTECPDGSFVARNPDNNCEFDPCPPIVGPFGVTLEDLQGVEVEFWHVWHGGVGDALLALIDEFNATNEYGITVVGYDQGGYGEMFTNMNAAINTGELPDLVVGYNNQFASWHMAGEVMVDLNDYVNDPYFGYTEEEIADFYPQFWSQDFIDGMRSGIPVQRSLQFMFYNSTWAQELGFDSWPMTPEEFKEQACASSAANNADDNPDNDGTGGWFINPDASTIASWVWAFGGEIADQDGYTFNTPEAIEALTFLKSLYDEGCAWSPESSYPNAEFATRQGLFYTSSIAGLPYQVGAFADAGNPDEWTVIPFPSVTGEPVMNVYGPSYALVTSTPAEQLGAFLFIKWFTMPENLARWIEASAYYPTRASALDFLGEYISANPQWAASRELIKYGKSEPRWPSWSSVRYTARDMFALIFQPDFMADQIPGLLSDLDVEAAAMRAED
ncbi:MAG: extracellular solute-binding protein [Chloroflexota bacterium]